MKSTWSNILPASVVEQGAADPDFALEHTEDPDPQDADTEVATDHWDLPPAKPWAPLPDDRPTPGSFVMVEPPRTPSLWARLSGVFR